jgi:hypothetical protein
VYDFAELDNCYVGIEDMRIFTDSIGDTLCFTGNRGLVDGSMRIQYGLINEDDNEIATNSVLLQYNQSHICEKNWVLFHHHGKKRIVYGWYPLVIGKMENDQFVEQQRLQTPAFFTKLRGSSHGVHVLPGEIWFLCHVVSHEDRRYYYHIFVVIDSETCAVKRTSKLFTFGKDQPVEYSCGFVVDGSNLLVGFSQGDCSSHILHIPLSQIPF